MNIKDLSEEKMKALAYDLIASIQSQQQQLQMISAELAKRTSEVKEPEKKAGVVEKPKNDK